MEDIGKELCGRVREVFEQRNSSNAFMVRLKDEIARGTATMRDTSLYSQTLGINLRRAIKEVVTPDELPDSTLYYNIAHSILEPLLRDTYEDVNAVCAEVQRKLDDKAGIHLAPQKADFPAERVRAAAGSASVKDTAAHGIEVLERTSENITAAFSDDYMKANADFRSRAGLDTYIERRDDGKCCEWCSKIAGRYSYPDKAPRDIFRRHDNCGCTVEYVCSKGRQDVWSKRWVSEPKKIEYSKPTVLTPKEAAELEKRLTSERESGIIKEKGMYRKASNTGAFSHLPERMSKAHIRELAKKYNIDIKGLTLNIDNNPELLRFPLAGEAVPEKIGVITFFPNSFKSEEELVRTLVHEKVHVEQFRKHGSIFVQNNRKQFEIEAEKIEEDFINGLKKEGLI